MRCFEIRESDPDASIRPLAAGFLTGKLVNNEHAGTRSSDENPLGKAIQKLLGAEDLHSAMKRFDTDVKSHGMIPMEVAVRWIAYHSVLKEHDGIILGASKIEQIQETVAMIRMGPLTHEVLKAAEDLWEAVRASREGII